MCSLSEPTAFDIIQYGNACTYIPACIPTYVKKCYFKLLNRAYMYVHAYEYI